MKYGYIFIYFLFLGLCNCEKEKINSQENILGDWDIKGGGTLFIETDSFSLSVGCNSIFGKIRIIENRIYFSLIASTLMGCPEAEGEKEKEFIRLLENNILNFSISGERAILFNENDEEIITLIRPLNESLVNSWDMISLRTQNAISYSILDSDFKIIFFENGTIRVTTSCNGGGGSFKIQNNNLSFLDLFFTEKACEPERNLREKEFSEALQSVNKFSVIRDKLKLMRDNEVWITFEKS